MGDRVDEQQLPIDAPSVPPGAVFDKYEIVRELGSGGMGSVHEARHVELGKRVAIKLLSRKLAKNKVYLERFLREGRIAAKLDHPNVVGVFDVGTWEGTPFLVMEYLSGQDLDDYLKERGVLEPAEAVDLLLPILSALDAAHRVGLVHRDIKPANIFLARAAHGGTHPKLLDFGIAKPNEDDEKGLTATSDVFGTPQYMAPEQVRRSRDATSRADQYAIAAVLYRCLTGCEAFPFGTSSVFELLERVVGGGFPAPRAIRPEIPERLDSLVVKAMARRPEDRFVSVRELGSALLPFAGPRARHTWEPAFATAEAVADTIPPEAAAAQVDQRATVVSLASRSAPGPETLSAASTDARLAPEVEEHAGTDRRKLIVAGIGLGVAASLVAILALSGPKGAAVPPAVTAIPTSDASSEPLRDASADIGAVTPKVPVEPAASSDAGAAPAASASASASASAAPAKHPPAAKSKTPAGGSASAPVTTTAAPATTNDAPKPYVID